MREYEFEKNIDPWVHLLGQNLNLLPIQSLGPNFLESIKGLLGFDEYIAVSFTFSEISVH